ncbi:hypothetical protein ACFLW7_00990 [Chloroflexota bacterium]
MNFPFCFGWKNREQYNLTTQRNTPPTLITLPLTTMLAAAQKEAKSLSMPPEWTSQGGSVCSLAKAHSGEAPQEAIDISVIRDIDLMQGGEYVLL